MRRRCLLKHKKIENKCILTITFTDFEPGTHVYSGNFMFPVNSNILVHGAYDQTSIVSKGNILIEGILLSPENLDNFYWTPTEDDKYIYTIEIQN